MVDLMYDGEFDDFVCNDRYFAIKVDNMDTGERNLLKIYSIDGVLMTTVNVGDSFYLLAIVDDMCYLNIQSVTYRVQIASTTLEMSAQVAQLDRSGIGSRNNLIVNVVTETTETVIDDLYLEVIKDGWGLATKGNEQFLILNNKLKVKVGKLGDDQNLLGYRNGRILVVNGTRNARLSFIDFTGNVTGQNTIPYVGPDAFIDRDYVIVNRARQLNYPGKTVFVHHIPSGISVDLSEKFAEELDPGDTIEACAWMDGNTFFFAVSNGCNFVRLLKGELPVFE